MEFKRLQPRLNSSNSSIVITVCAASIFLILCTSTMVDSATLIHHQKRSAVITQQNNNNIAEECSDGAPCGWEVYVPHTRSLAYYVQSSCKCKAKETCVQTDDDVIISAYVYKCRVIPRRQKPRNSHHSHASSTGPSSDS